MGMSVICIIFALQFGNNETKAPFVCTAFCRTPRQPDCLCIHSGSFKMKEIPLTMNQVAIVDDGDYEYLNQWKWHATKYKHGYYANRSELYDERVMEGKRRTVVMHRVIANPSPGMQVDHINRNGLDNRRCNLRVVTLRENQQNRRDQAQFPCVQKYRRRYKAKMSIGYKQVYLGSFKTPEEAYSAYLNAIKELPC